MSWPDRFPEDKVYDKTVSAMDIFPTLHAALDLELPTDRSIDGVNLMPYLTGENNNSPHEWLFWTGFNLKGKPYVYDDPNSALARHDRTYNGDNTGWAVRYQHWKLRYFGRSDQYALFDLDKDISESTNLAEEHPDLVEKMKNRFFEWHEEIKKDHKNFDVPESSEF